MKTYRWPNVAAILACAAVAAAVVAADAFFNAQQGYLARPPDYDGVGYMNYAEAPYHLIGEFHVKAAVAHLNNIAPLWTAVIAAHYLAFGDGPFQAFATRFWPVVLLLVLVYWLVRARAPRPLAIAAVGLTGLLPIVSAGVRASSWEFFSHQANYNDEWGLDDLRPDFFAVVLLLWAVALLAEHNHSLRRTDYLLSAAFAAAAVLMKPSTAPVTLAVWGAALAITWFWNRAVAGTPRRAVEAAGFCALLLLPWAIAGGAYQVLGYLYEVAVTYKSAYSLSLSLGESLTYYLVRIPAQVGQVEGLPVIAAAALLVVALVRSRLGRAEGIYAGLTVLLYVAFTLTTNKNPHVGEWFSLALWIFVITGLARLATSAWPERIVRWSPRILAGVAAYLLVVYAAGAFALAGWPLNEHRADAQLLAVTSALAHELRTDVAVGQCFTYAPGPGWPASLEILMTNRDGTAPRSTQIDVNPSSTTDAYIANARQCPAVVVYRDDIQQVARAFFCPPVRQPYMQALSSWVREPGNGYRLARSWRFDDLPPAGPHTLGQYQGVSLTLDLYLRSAP